MPQVSLTQMVDSLSSQPTLVSFPTDTVPALAARAEYAELIYAAKQRPPEKPLILMGASLADLLPYVTGSDEATQTWRSLTEKHWPGQLTLVLPASDRTPSTLNPLDTGTVGIRVPNHPIALQLLSRTGPLATTSANLSGQPPLTLQADIARTFPDALTLELDVLKTDGVETEGSKTGAVKETLTSGQPSTVALWTAPGWKILRQGNVQL
ncbi:MAG: L-threonylcarbamoyladenylate synthase [Cyanobacteria bacterium J06632_3]